MKTGIDAKWYFEGPVSNRLVVQKLVQHMIAANKGHRLYFFLNRKHRHLPFHFSGPGIETVYVWGGNNLISNLFILPFYGKKLGLDGILYQNFGSFWGPERWVYIHDVVFLSHPRFFSLAERLYFSFMPLLLRFAAKIITISYSEKKRIETWCPGLKVPVEVVHHGRDGRFLPAEKCPQNELNEVKSRLGLPGRYLLFVGRLNVRKNLGRLAEAVMAVPDCPPLMIIGEKDWKSDPGLDSLLENGETEGKLRRLGKVSANDLPLVYAGAEIFCFVSLAEGFGLPVLEAMSAGIPVLTSADSAMSEICGSAAEYCNPMDTQSIAQALSSLLNDREKRAQLSLAGLKRQEEFDWDHTAKRLLEIMEKKS